MDEAQTKARKALRAVIKEQSGKLGQFKVARDAIKATGEDTSELDGVIDIVDGMIKLVEGKA